MIDPFQKLVLSSFASLKKGTLTLIGPDGEEQKFGGKEAGLNPTIELKNDIFFRKCVVSGPIGFGESFVDGDWETPDLTEVIAFFILNSDSMAGIKTEGGRSSIGIGLLNVYNRLLHKRRPNSLEKSRVNISEHYDLSNDFFRLWLDPSMTYSCAYFDPPDLSLEQAQKKKYDELCRKLQIAKDDEVLEIGTGWGGFSIHAAKNYGCRVTTVTISEEQFAEARVKVEEAGLEDLVRVRLQDYREVTGHFDKIVSIEMIEAVGDAYIDTFVEACEKLLKPRGLLGLQMITCPDRQYKFLRDGVDFIQKHIFPGSLLVSQARMTVAFNRTGWLNLLDWEDMGPYYAKTLRSWATAFELMRETVLTLGFDERFLRKWRYYLRYCEAAFGTRHISVVQAIYTRPNNLNIESDVYEIGK
ncbi:MAG: cyclopropane-fatty-acyl-phospholipid synthase family protein [Chthoniobacterales bacterium]